MDKEVEAILDKVRQKRIEKGFSILNLANAADISHSHLYYIETKQKIPTIETLNRIAKALSLELKDFL
ncbi:MAG: helix-turn-helix transcriptional regulator [Spirochaetia bacterium]|nr:helix-turn-helix transcriptional regulator [Spirochaetia bacterium]